MLSASTDTTSDKTGSRPAALICAVVLCAISAMTGRMVFLRFPWDGDAGTFIYCGKAVADGARFCHDIYDNKFPTAALWNGLWWRVCGLHWFAYVTGGGAMALLTAFVLAFIARRHAGRTAFLPTLLFGLVYLNFCPVVFGGFQSETALTLFAALAAAFALEAVVSGRCLPAFICGLVAGTGAYIKPTGLAMAGVFLIVSVGRACYSRQGIGTLIKQCISLAAGVLIPIGAAISYLCAADILRDMPWLYRQISAYANESIWDRYSAIKLLVAAAFLVLPLYARYRQPRETSERPLSNHHLAMLLAAVWLVLEFADVTLQRRMYAYHFLVLAAPAALLFGLIRRRFELRAMFLPLIPAIVFSLWGFTWQLQRSTIGRLPLSDYLVAHAHPGDSIWMDNVPRLLLETGLPSGSRHVLTFPFFNTDHTPLEMGPQLLGDLAERRPRYIILATDTLAALDRHCALTTELAERPVRRANFRAIWLSVVAYVSNHYRPEIQLGDRTVYVRVDE